MKRAEVSATVAGGKALFVIVVANKGPAAARSVTVGDWVPAGASWSVSDSRCWFSKGELICNLENLAPGASRVIRLAGTVARSCTTLTNTAFVQSDNDLRAGDNRARATIHVSCAAPKPPVNHKPGHVGYGLG